jgi:hypothetical protein
MSLAGFKSRHSSFSTAIAAGILLTLQSPTVHGQTAHLIGGPKGSAPRIYIPTQDGFESYLSAAIVKKHVPGVVTQNKDDAQFVLTSTVEAKEESAGSKVARCLFLYCAGMEGSQIASVQLVDAHTQEVMWAYTVHKASARAYQSTAEAVAKHLKHFLEEHPN